MDGIDQPQRPVREEIRAAIFLGEDVVFIEFEPYRRSAARLGDGRQAIDVIIRRIGRARAPDEIRAWRAVTNTHRPIPRQLLVPLHVAVEREQLPIAIEGRVVGIAEAGGDQAHILAFVVHPPDGAAGREDIGGVAA